MWKRRMLILLVSLFTGLLAVSCGKEESLKNGYYTAEMSEYSHGWKEHVTICVMENRIVSVEYNAENMNGKMGTYPNKYTREYARQLLENQSADNIDAVSGASTSGGNFVKLAAAVLEKAQNGDPTIAVVE